MEEHFLEIGCPPGNPRPTDLLPEVIKNTGLTTDDFKLVAQVFGDFTWKVNEDKVKTYVKARDVIGKRLDQLYTKRTIRYASW